MEQFNNEVRVILDSLKKVLRTKRVTYSQIASSLEISESSVKKLFSDGRCSLERLCKISQLAGISLQELIDLTHERKYSKSELTERQESVILESMELQTVFVAAVIHQKTLPQITEATGMTEKTVRKCLRILDDEGILEVHEKDRVKLLVSEPIHMSANFRNRYFITYWSHLGESLNSQLAPGTTLKEGREVLASKATVEEFSIELSQLLKRLDENASRDRLTTSVEKLIPLSLGIGALVGSPLKRSAKPPTNCWRSR